MKQTKLLTAGLLSCLMAFGAAGCSMPGVKSSDTSAAQSSTAAETAAQTGSETAGNVPSAANGYLVSEKMGEEVKIDLDGDGTADTLTVSVTSKEISDPTSSWTESVLDSIVVNGKELAVPGTDDPLKAYKVYLETPDKEQYFITDLDTKDNALEIALLDYGPSDDPVTWYFQYKDGALQSLGSIPGFPNDKESQRDGNGNVMTVGRLGLFQTWYATFPYTLKDGMLTAVEQSQYVPLQDNENAVTLKKELTLYAKPDQKSDTVKVQPSKDPVTFPATDNKNWVQMHMADGTEGWIYLKDFSTIVSGDQELSSSDAFDNLTLVD